MVNVFLIYKKGELYIMAEDACVSKFSNMFQIHQKNLLSFNVVHLFIPKLCLLGVLIL